MNKFEEYCPSCKGGSKARFPDPWECVLCGGSGKYSDAISRILSGEVRWQDSEGPFLGCWVDVKTGIAAYVNGKALKE